MKKLIRALAGLALLVGALVLSSQIETATASPQTDGLVCEAPVDLPPMMEEVKKKGDCSFQSDCGGAKCCKGRCAWASGSCCSFDSDCGFKGAKCRSGKCSNAPDGKCSFNSECPSGRCSSGKCK